MSFHRPKRAHGNSQDFHGPEMNTISTSRGNMLLSIHEQGSPPHFRLSGLEIDTATVVTKRENDTHTFAMEKKRRILAVD